MDLFDINKSDINKMLENYKQIQSNVQEACQSLSDNKKVNILAVSKTKPEQMIRELFLAGQCDFGENYLQEAIAKMQQLQDLPIIWHYIGSIQRNKTKDIAKHFDWVHTIERDVIATRLNQQRAGLPPLNVLIQINIDDESSKSGCRIDEVDDLVRLIVECENLRLRGLMVIPNKAGSDAFIRTKQIFDEIGCRYHLPQWDTLSMGMSGDMLTAITHGSTMLRIGSAIFGSRA